MKNMHFKHKLPIPKEIKERYPLTAELARAKAARDALISDIFTGKSNKMLLIHMKNMIKYFNKWGWIFDEERKKWNAEILEKYS